MEDTRFVKICPSKKCTNRINDAQELDCVECGLDLVMVPIVEYSEELRELVESGNYPPKKVEEPPAPEITADPIVNLVKICESCGYENMPQYDSCNKCDDYIGDIMPVKKGEEASIQDQTSSLIHYELTSLDGEYKYQIKKNWQILGRSQECKSYLSKRSYVSREHAVLTIEDSKLYIEDRITTNRNYEGGVNNRTFVNSISLVNGEVKQLHEGDIIALGDPNPEEINAGFFRVGLIQ